MSTRYATNFTDDQIVEALKVAAAAGVKRDFAGDRLQPPNLAAFFGNLPRPERDRLLGLVYPAAEAAAAPTRPQSF